MTAARDPYRYFRIEGRELLDGLNQGVLELERAPAAGDLVARLLRFAHTLKGASRVVKLGEIADRAHAVEGILAPYRTGSGPVGREPIDSLQKLLDEISARLSSIDPAVGPAPSNGEAGVEKADGARERVASTPQAPPHGEEAVRTVRVELQEMDALLESVSEASVQVHALRRESSEVERVRQLADTLVEQLNPRRSGNSVAQARLLAGELREAVRRVERNLGGGIEHAASELAQVRDAANLLRLLPVASAFSMLERAARDAARSAQKNVEFRATGGGIRLDAHVLAALRDALLHIVRNAVAHGIEPEAERLAGGKPAAGQIELLVERRGHRVAFICRDDGRGIDVAALGEAALRQGLLTNAGSAHLTPQEAFRLLLRGGLTTTRTVTDLSGRGIGLDVVREIATRLKADVSVQSEPGRGARFELVVPVSLSSFPALFVEAGGVTASLPLDAVRAIVRLPDAEIARASGAESVIHEGKVIPFLALSDALRDLRPSSVQRKTWSAVVVQSDGASVAMGVDRVRSIATIVVQPLPPHAAVDAVVAGASLDASGDPQLVLDPNGLVGAARRTQRARAAAPSPRKPVLVVDDSLTTRMLEQSILEAAGYEVDLAISGEDALGKARRRRYGVFLVDVEMPGMDGFQFVAQTRADPQLREIPAILVTSLASPEDRRRGQAAGARAHIAKGEFDQAVLLGMIRDFMG